MAATIEKRIKEIISDRLGIGEDQVTDTAHLMDDLGADSLDMTEIVLDLEDEYDIEIPDREADELMTAAAIANYVTERRG